MGVLFNVSINIFCSSFLYNFHIRQKWHWSLKLNVEVLVHRVYWVVSLSCWFLGRICHMKLLPVFFFFFLILQDLMITSEIQHSVLIHTAQALTFLWKEHKLCRGKECLSVFILPFSWMYNSSRGRRNAF